MPEISIGMPVYNGEKSLTDAIQTLLSQTFTNFELIISDNYSTDGTEAICRHFASIDNRIKYIRQSCNIGAVANFKFVFDQATCEYFLWAACDDVRSSDFLEENHKFLSSHLDFVASTSPNKLEGNEEIINFKLDGTPFERFVTFFKYCWVSHAIFYSLIRTSVLRKCDMLDQSFLAYDWAVDLFLASKGKINRTQNGLTVFGSSGVSSKPDFYKSARNIKIEILIPFFILGKYVQVLVKDFEVLQKIRIILIFFRLNAGVWFDQIRSNLYSIYCKYIRNRIRAST